MLVGMKKDLHGLRVHGVEGEIGKLEEFYFDAASFVVQHGVVETGTWMETYKIRVPVEALHNIDWEQRLVATKWTKAQAEAYPRVHTDRPLIRQDEIDPAAAAVDPSLRSSAAVIGAHLVGTDGEVGRVTDCLVDPSSWSIPSLVVDVDGTPLLITPGRIARMDWDDARVCVDMTSEQIKASPEYDASKSVQPQDSTPHSR